MSIGWRTTAIVAGAALVLSVLVGVLGGVAFGTILIRGLLGAFAFGAGSIGIRYLVDRYLPELRQGQEVQQESPHGSRVDIVGDDDPLEEGLRPDAPLAGGTDSDAYHDEGDEQDGESNVDAVESEEDVEDLDEVDEIDEVDGPRGQEAPAEKLVPAAEGSDDEARMPEDQDEQEFRPGVDAEVLSSQDALPDMNSFSDTFTELPTDAEVSEDEGIEGSHSGEDPSMMARAIQTVLKRGEE